MGWLDRFERFVEDVLLLPEEVRLRLDDAEARLRAGDAQAALEQLEDLLVLRPTLGRAAVLLAEAERALGRSGRARDAVTRARELAPDDAMLALLSAKLALDAGDGRAASEDARTAIAGLGPNRPHDVAEALWVRARAEWLLGRPDRAVRDLRKALALVPDARALEAEIVEVLAAMGALTEARRIARRLPPSDLGIELAERVGTALLTAGDAAGAEPFLRAAADRGAPRAALGLVDALLRSARLDEAEVVARRIASARFEPSVLERLAEIAASQGAFAEASDALADAAELANGDVELLRRALAACPPDDAPRLARRTAALAARVGESDEDVVLARALTATDASVEQTTPIEAGWSESAVPSGTWSPRVPRVSAAAGDVARDDVAQPPRFWLAVAAHALARSRPREALGALDRHAASSTNAADNRFALALRRRALERLWRTPSGELDLGGALDGVAEIGGAEAGVGAFGGERLARRANELREAMATPLRAAIMGEFNAGKSTFVNVFVGTDVAPTGVLPTTAILHVLRGGTERRAVVVRRDGTTREGPAEDLRRMLADELGELDHVQISWPSEILDRVSLLDTPGTNAVDPRHEAAALEAVRRADAVLWLFDATQVGKDTERKVLTEIAREGIVVFPIVNKADRLRPGEREEIERALLDAMPFLRGGPAVSFVSTRQARRAQTAGDLDALDASGWPSLLAALEQRLFATPTVWKRRATVARLAAAVVDALEVARHAHVARRQIAATLAAERARAVALEPSLHDRAEQVVREVGRAVDDAFDGAAAEALAFVRPHQSRFVRDGADAADRAFLADLLDRAVGDAVARAEELLSAELAVALGAVSGRDETNRVRAAVRAPFAAFTGYQRGVLAGGSLSRFFERATSRAALARSNVADLLAPARADVRSELLPNVAEALRALVAEVESDIARRELDASREAERLERSCVAPLEALAHVLGDAAALEGSAKS